MFTHLKAALQDSKEVQELQRKLEEMQTSNRRQKEQIAQQSTLLEKANGVRRRKGGCIFNIHDRKGLVNMTCEGEHAA